MANYCLSIWNGIQYEMEGKKTIFQRNNAPLHKAVSTKKRIRDF